MFHQKTISFARSFVVAASLGAFAFVGGVASASTMTPNGEYEAKSVTTNGHDHALWLVGFLGSGADRYWQFEDGTSKLVVKDETARLTGTVVQNTNPANRMKLALNFGFRGTGVAGHTGAPLKCGGGCADAANWDFFDFVSGKLFGVSPSLMGLHVKLRGAKADVNGQSVPYPVQLGNGANDKNPGLGLSTWFGWETSKKDTYFNGFRSGRGDVNINLAPVPLPATGLLLIGAVGAMGVAARRRRRAT